MTNITNRRRSGAAAAFTLVEALVAISITAIASSVLLLGIGSSFQSTTDAQEQTIATGIAQQLMDEVLGGRYIELGGSPYDPVLAPGGAEAGAGTRELFDDIADYNDWRSQPPEDLWGISLGAGDEEGAQRHPNFQIPAGYFDRWREEIDVYYVDETDLLSRLPPGQTSDYRVVEVRIIHEDPHRGTRELAKIRRVVAYVSPL